LIKGNVFTLVLQELPVIEGPNDYPTGGEPMDECSSDSQVVSNQVKDFNGLTDIYWVCSFFINDFFHVVLCSIAP
jgi:hypothetical protein